jgi:hypothetical protein
MKTLFGLFIIAACICAWCPWLSSTTAAALVAANVKAEQVNYNTCALTIDPTTLHKVLFGYTEGVAYACTVDDQVLTQGDDTVFVTFFNLVMGVPKPLIK